jgi:hypothetical protein
MKATQQAKSKVDMELDNATKQNSQSAFGGEICIMIKNSYTIEERGRKKEMCGENSMSSLI